MTGFYSSDIFRTEWLRVASRFGQSGDEVGQVVYRYISYGYQYIIDNTY